MKEKLSTNQVDVFGLFPIAVYSTNIRKFTVEELKFVKKHKREVVSNRGNTYTKNTYLLEEREFKNLKTIYKLFNITFFNNNISNK